MRLQRALILRRARLIVVAWACSSLFFTAVLMASDLGGRKPLSFALYANGVHFALWTALLPVIWRSASLLPLPGRKRGAADPWARWKAVALLLIVPALAALVAFTHWAIVYWTYFPYWSIYPTFRVLLRSELIRFMPVDTLIGLVLLVAFAGWQAWQALQQERARTNDLEQQLVVARLDALRMQLHPHFLFNTLHTIAGLTVEDAPTARRMVIALGDFLRRTLKGTDEGTRTLSEELEYSDLYLGIEKLRLGERLVLNYEIDPAATRAFVPQFLLQPLFENAIRHGAARMTGPCEIRFRASCKPDVLDLLIRNDGPKRDLSTGPLRFGVGLTNTMNRLRIHYGNRYTFQFADRPEAEPRSKCPSHMKHDAKAMSMPARALIIDDELHARRYLRELLASEPHVEVVGEGSNGVEGAQQIRELSPDIVFVDIQMPDLDGFGMIDRAVGARAAPVFVFVTAYSEHAVKAFEIEAVDYVCKPFDKERLSISVERAVRRLNSTSPGAIAGRYLSRLSLKDDERIVFLPVEEIVWIESANKYVVIHTAAGSHISRQTIQGLEHRLDPSQFVRTHRSTLVRKAAVRGLHPLFHGDYIIKLANGAEVALSRNFREAFFREMSR